jgi:V/A-type H+/Na+-transporting ATPase subunit K
MDIFAFLGQIGLGLPLGLAAIGSSIGIFAAGQAAVGAWGKEAKAGKPLRFSYIILTGMPLSQTIYAFVFMNGLAEKVLSSGSLIETHAGTILGGGLACGVAELASAWLQGKIGAAACRSLSEGEGKGLAFMIIAMGIVETVGLLGFVFLKLSIADAL